MGMSWVIGSVPAEPSAGQAGAARRARFSPSPKRTSRVSPMPHARGWFFVQGPGEAAGDGQTRIKGSPRLWLSAKATAAAVSYPHQAIARCQSKVCRVYAHGWAPLGPPCRRNNNDGRICHKLRSVKTGSVGPAESNSAPTPRGAALSRGCVAWIELSRGGRKEPTDSLKGMIRIRRSFRLCVYRRVGGAKRGTGASTCSRLQAMLISGVM